MSTRVAPTASIGIDNQIIEPTEALTTPISSSTLSVNLAKLQTIFLSVAILAYASAFRRAGEHSSASSCIEVKLTTM
jgi:hypothetical protein